MKKILFLLLLLCILSLVLVSCGNEDQNKFHIKGDISDLKDQSTTNKDPSVGLSYSLDQNETYYIVSGLGTCTDKDVVIPSTYNNKLVKEIGESAFSGCSSLTSVKLPSSLKSIGVCAFSGCSSLEGIEIPSGVLSIGAYAFEDCELIKSITIPDSVTSIGNDPFRFCPIETFTGPSFAIDYLDKFGLVTITITSGSSMVNFTNCLSLETITIADSVKSIPAYTFYNCISLTTVNLGNGIESIGDFAFYNCSAFKSLVLPNSVKSIGKQAFYNCLSLESINFGNGLTTISNEAFCNCLSLTIIELPKSVISINKEVFKGCSNVEKVIVPFIGDKRHTATDTYQYPFGYLFGEESYTGGVETFQKYYTKDLSTINSTNYYLPSKLKEVSITDASCITAYAFYNCSNLETVNMPNTVSSIDNSAFYNCTKLKNISSPDTITSLGLNVFYNCISLTNFSIPTYVTTIPSSAFFGCSSLVSIVIPDKVSSIGNNAFKNCSSLTNVYFTGTQDKWNSVTKGTNNECLTNATITCNYIPE